MAESIYQNLVTNFYADAPISVHLCSFPVKDEEFVDANLERDMAVVTEVVVLGRSARNSANIKNRQPLNKLFVTTERKVNLTGDLLEIAKDELNVKEVELLVDAEKFVSYKIKPQLKTLGPKYGAKLGLIRNYLETCNASKIVETVKKGETFKVELGGSEVEFTEADLLISSESMPGFVSANENGITVVLDSAITEELLLEGILREITSKIQTMRKEAGFEVTDRIKIYYTAEGNALKVMQTMASEILNGVLAVEIIEGNLTGYVKEWDISADKVTLGVQKV